VGREIRRVPPNWQHPKDDRGQYLPMHDEHFADRFAKWLADFDRIRRGELEDWERECYASDNPLAEWLLDEGSPLDPSVYRPYRDEDDRSWWQVYETVSEGTPVTPAFATKAELVDYLVDHGDRWGEGRKYPRARAEAFVEQGFASSMTMTVGSDGKPVFRRGIDSVDSKS
jgi:hypothetical protein